MGSTRWAIDGRAAVQARGERPWPLVTAVVLAHNRREALRTTLTTLQSGLDYPTESLEIVVVDNASSDGTVGMVAREFPDVRLLAMQENLGMPALNRAFAGARGDWVLTLDDDCSIEGRALKLAVAAAEVNQADLVSFRVRSGVEPGVFFTDVYSMGLLGFWGCAWLVGRSALRRVGGFDPEIFIWGNEVEFTMRLLDARMRHLHLPEVVAVHMAPVPRDYRDLRRHRMNFRHWCHTAAKLLTPADAARVIGRLLLRIAIDAVAVSPRAGLTVPCALVGTVSGLRGRQPVRSDVSALYREHFVSFANPLARRGSGSRERERFYPTADPAVLDI